MHSCMSARYDPGTCKDEMSSEKWYSTCLLPPAIVCCFCAVVCKQYISNYVTCLLLFTHVWSHVQTLFLQTMNERRAEPCKEGGGGVGAFPVSTTQSMHFCCSDTVIC